MYEVLLILWVHFTSEQDKNIQKNYIFNVWFDNGIFFWIQFVHEKVSKVFHIEKTNQPYATTKKKHGIVFFSKERRTIEHDNVNLQWVRGQKAHLHRSCRRYFRNIIKGSKFTHHKSIFVTIHHFNFNFNFLKIFITKTFTSMS